MAIRLVELKADGAFEIPADEEITKVSVVAIQEYKIAGVVGYGLAVQIESEKV